MIVITFVIICTLLYILFRKHANYWKNRGIVFEKPWPLIGNMLDVILLRKNIAVMIGDMYLNHTGKPYFGMWAFTQPNLIIRSPDLIKHILVKDFEYFYDRNVQNNEKVDPYTANMMFFTRNPKWKHIRNMTTPIFTSGQLRYIYPNIQVVAKNLVSFIKARKTHLDARNVMSKYSTDVICSIAFGIDALSFQDDETSFTNAARETFKPSFRNAFVSATYFLKSPLVDIFRIKFVKSSVANFLDKTFKTIVKERETLDVKRRDLIDIMIKLRNQFNLNEYELVSQADQFFLAGYETSSTAITFGLYELSRSKDIQYTLREELNQIIRSNSEFSYEFFSNSKTYLHKFVLETLRKYPLLPMLGRECAKDYRISNSNVIIEKGTSIVIPLMGLHHDPEYFPNPEEFDPERFSEENVRERNSYCYLPFGAGPRNCIGQRIALMSVKMAVAFLVKNFEIELESDNFLLKISPMSFALVPNPIILNFKEIA